MKNIGIQKGKHLIVFSSAVVYANPESPYGKRKMLLEKTYEDYCKRHKINLTIFRLFNVYGNYQIPHKQGSLIANIFYNYINHKQIEINDMKAMRDFVCAKDIGEIVKWVIENNFFEKSDIVQQSVIILKGFPEADSRVHDNLLGIYSCRLRPVNRFF